MPEDAVRLVPEADQPAVPQGLNPFQTGLIEAIGLPAYTTDTEGKITAFNEAAVELWGRRPEIGKDLWCGSWRIYQLDGEPMPLDACPMAVALREEREVRGVEILIERPDGGRIRVLPYPTPLRDESGRVTGAINLLVDITEIRESEAVRSRLAAIVESSNDAVVSKNLDGIIQTWNHGAERLFGYTAEEIVGKSIRLLIPADRQGEEDEVIRKIRAGERVEHFDTVRLRKDGSEVHVSLTISPVRNAAGVIIGASKVARDISSRKASDDALRQTLAVKDEFVGLVSHELKTPLSTILGNGYVLRRSADLMTDEQRAQAYDDIVVEGEKLRDNLEHLLVLTRLEAEPIQFESLSLSEVVSACVDSFKRRHGRTVTVHEEPGLPCVQGDGTLVELVVQNLLTNAGKYSPAHTDIEVSVLVNSEGCPEVQVRDHGIGLDSVDLKNLFTPFYRSDRARDVAKGLGLGLTVCSRALEAQGGGISATSAPGEGSIFRFYLPPG